MNNYKTDPLIHFERARSTWRTEVNASCTAMMDACKDRIGEHAAEHALPWAVSTLGPVPAQPVARLDWQCRAASIGAYRELSGYGHPAGPIGPPPVTAASDIRAAWQEAGHAPAVGPDVRGMPNGMLCICATPTRRNRLGPAMGR